MRRKSVFVYVGACGTLINPAVLLAFSMCVILLLFAKMMMHMQVMDHMVKLPTINDPNWINQIGRVH